MDCHGAHHCCMGAPGAIKLLPAGVQDSNANGVFTMVWGTDINVTDVQRQFTDFVRQYRVQTGTTAEGRPITEDEPKYMAYLQDVRAPG